MSTLLEKPRPWDSPDWMAEAKAWITDRLKAAGRPGDGSFTEMKVSSISCVLRAGALGGPVYFKAASRLPLFTREASVTAGLSELLGDAVPRVLALDKPRDWLLMEDFGALAGWEAPPEAWIAAIREFALLQQGSSHDVSRLLELGCLDRRPAVLQEQLDPLFEWLQGQQAGLEANDLRALLAAKATLKGFAAELDQGILPDSLVHGDLHMGNIAGRAGRHVFFDWTDACVAHPMMDLIAVLQAADARLATDILEAYLDAWKAYASKASLRHLARLALPLCALHQLVSYQHILAGGYQGAEAEFGKLVPFWAKQALKGAA